MKLTFLVFCSQGRFPSSYTPYGATKTTYLYFYNSRCPLDPHVYEWASGRSGYFELLLPPGHRTTPSTTNDGPIEDGCTPPREGALGDTTHRGDDKRGAKCSPQRDSPGVWGDSGVDGPKSADAEQVGTDDPRPEQSGSSQNNTSAKGNPSGELRKARRAKIRLPAVRASST